jgi:hypothetical protein
MAIQAQVVNVVVMRTFLELETVEDVAVARARSNSDFFVDYCELESVDFSKVRAPLSDCATSVDDNDDSSSSWGSDSEDSSSSQSRDSDRWSDDCPPGVFSWPAVQPCALVRQVAPVAFPMLCSAPQVRQTCKTQAAIQDGTMTSLMLRNIPNNLKRDALLELFDNLGFKGLYDFVYLPIDFSRNSNVGYCFVNLVEAAVASKFQATFQGFQGWRGSSRKVCEAVWTELNQGLACHVDRYRNSPVMHADVPDECRPILFKDGKRIEFPAPTKALKRPKMRVVSAKGGIQTPSFRRHNKA